VILIVPVLFFLFGAVVDISRVWLARIELTNALEAAALSGVKTWGEAGVTANNNPLTSPALRQNARTHAVTAAAANTVIGQDPAHPENTVVVSLNRNESVGSTPNDNTFPTGELVLGQITASGNSFTFTASTAPANNNEFAVHTQKTMTIYSIWTKIFGIPLGPYQITSGAVAMYDGVQPRIAFVTSYAP